MVYPLTFIRNCAILVLAVWLTPVQGQRIRPAFAPEQGAHIILLGNTFADRMRHYGYFETLLQTSFPGKHLSVRNLGWSADEVGLQPRPLNFPGWGEKTSRLTTGSKEVTFQGYTYEGAKIVMPVPLNFPGLNQNLTDQKADVIFLCFGMNEAFQGEAGLPQFEKDLNAFIQNLLAHQYNGRCAPTLVLVSPITHEDLGGQLPNPDGHNRSLRLYTEAMRKAADAKGLHFIDLFAPSGERMGAKNGPMTINGIHLNDAGYRLAAAWMARSLGFGSQPDFDSEHSRKLKEVIKMKDDHFFYRWRAVNGEYIYGRRREPFGVIAFPPELRKLNQMTAALDSVIWEMGKGVEAYTKALDIVDRRGKPMDPLLTPDIPMTGRQGEAAKAAAHGHHTAAGPATTEGFKLPPGYAINLFASEKDFPIEKPVAMNFDARGRLWVATMPTYPQYFPGIPVHDRIVILEDTDHDGKADKHTVFADDLYLPLGFEFANGGIYVAQEPDILFLKDTDGDDRADVREIILTGFGSEDSHHASHAFTYGQDGALYFNEGTFLNTQVETPYGPVRSYAGATYRYEPRTAKLTHYISYPYYNPWGSVFDAWGTHLIGDASDGSNYFAPPMTGNITYPAKHPRIDMFTETRVRPTAGIEIISSRQFPDAVQGDFLVNNNIGFQGTKQHRIIPSGSGIGSQEVAPLLQSSDPNFRPIDLEFGPDGALYIVDWYNPLISHGENPPRDPARDKSHGRVWRITHTDKPLLEKTDISGQGVVELLENLKVYEDRFRYRSRIQLREKAASEVMPHLAEWLAGLDENAPEFERHRLEALWLYQDFNVVEETLLKSLLQAREPQARAAATKVLLYWRDRIPGSLELMRTQVNDPSPRVRLEAVVALSFFDSEKAVTAALDVFHYPTDYYLDYAIRETFGFLKPLWLQSLRESVSVNPTAERYLLSLATSAELLTLARQPQVLEVLLFRPDLTPGQKRDVVNQIARARNSPVEKVLIDAIRTGAPASTTAGARAARQGLVALLLQSDRAALKANTATFAEMISRDTAALARAAGYAGLITAERSDQTAWATAQASPAHTDDYLRGISLLTDPDLKATLFKRVKALTSQTPATAFPLLVSMSEKRETKIQALKEFVAYLSNTPEPTQRSDAFTGQLQQVKDLTEGLPEKDRTEILRRVEKLGTLEIKLTAVEAKMAFDKKELSVPAGRHVSLLFENPDLMPHNVVILKPGSTERVGQAADAMATLRDGFERNFIPEGDDVLFATPLVNPGKSFRLDFKAPSQPGEYPFICSFPGHWRVMQGILTVR